MFIYTNRIITMDDLFDLAESTAETEFKLSWDSGPMCHSVFEEDALSSNRLFLKKLNALITKKFTPKPTSRCADQDEVGGLSNEE